MISSTKYLFAFLILFFICFCVSLKAQTSLAVDKKGKIKRLHFYQGNPLIVKTKLNKKITISGTLTQINDSSITLDGTEILIKNIKYIVNPNKGFGWKLLSKTTFIAGIFFFSLDAGNRIINNEGPVIGKRNLLISLPLIAVGYISKTLSYKKLRNKNGNIHTITLN